MNKKILILSVIMLAVVIGAGFWVYKYGGALSITQTPQDDVSPTIEVITQQGGNNENGSLTICADKCGDGVCQNENTECTDLNCICKEDVKECPQDCK